MKLAFAAITLAIATALTACQSTSSTALVTGGQVLNTVKDADLSKLLTAYTWVYHSKDLINPIAYTFTEDRVSMNAGCNTVGSSWQVKDSKLITGAAMSTMIGCSEPQAALDNFGGKLISERKAASIRIDTSNKQQPILTLEGHDGKSYQLKGIPTPETKYQGQGETVFMEVAAAKKACTGVGNQQCLEVREIKYDDKGLKTSVGEWSLFYDRIEGFTHDPKMRTVLRLKKFTLKNPAADQSKYAYVHDMTVEQEIIK